MTKKHAFMLEPGSWIGEGSVTFSASTKQLFFITKWRVYNDDEPESEGIVCEQLVQTEGNDEPVHNTFQVHEVSPTRFAIALENEAVGQVLGRGIIDDKTIAWEFQDNPHFQGYEVYELQEDGEYSFHAEYASDDSFRTIVDGRIRRQKDSKEG